MSEYKQGPCPNPECGSSDAFTEYENGSKCFSCGIYIPNEGNEKDDREFTVGYHPHRGLSNKTLEFYKVQTKFVEGKPTEVAFPYPNESVKFRKLDKKEFWVKGNHADSGLFGRDKFDPGSFESVTITEGEYDALSIYQASGGKTAAVSLPGATALKAIKQDFKWIDSFNKIVIATDNDEAGKQAANKIASMFDPKKVFFVHFEKFKDANEYLQNGKIEDLFRAWVGASKSMPAGIIHSFKDIEEALKKHEENRLVEYPFEFMQNALKGLHRGEFVLFKGLEGIGKTEIFRALEYHTLKHSTEKVGIIRLEETYGDTIRGISTYELQAPAMNEDAGISDTEAFEAYKKAVGGDEDRCFIQSTFDTDDPDAVLSNIRFLVSSCGCSIIFLDHLSMLVTGVEEEDERKKLDYICTRLKKMAIQLGFCVVSIIHVNDNGQTRSSRYPPKIANTVVHLERDIRHPDPKARRVTKLTVEKARSQGCTTGPIGSVIYDNEVSFTLKELKPYEPEDDLSEEQLEAVA